MPGNQVLNLTPSTELHFEGPYTEVVTAELSLANPSDDVVYFKVKTTAPRYYCVRPNSGVIAPNEAAKISVMLQPVESTEALEKERSRHKFMIQSATAVNDDTPVDEFWRKVSSNSVMDSKLKVVFDNLANINGTGDINVTAANTTEQRQAHDTHHQQQPSANTTSAQHNRAAVAADDTRKMSPQSKSSQEQAERSHKVLTDENFSLVSQVQELRHKLNAATRHPTQSTGISLVQLILVALAAALLGVIVGKLL